MSREFFTCSGEHWSAALFALRCLSTCLEMNYSVLYRTDICSQRTSTSSLRYNWVLTLESSDHIVWTSTSSKLLFRNPVSQIFDITFLKSEMVRSFSRKIVLSNYGLWKDIISWFALLSPVLLDKVSSNMAIYSMKRIKGDGGVCVTGHGS